MASLHGPRLPTLTGKKSAKRTAKRLPKRGRKVARFRGSLIPPATPEQRAFFKAQDQHAETRELARELLLRWPASYTPTAAELAWEAARAFVELDHARRPKPEPGTFPDGDDPPLDVLR